MTKKKLDHKSDDKYPASKKKVEKKEKKSGKTKKITGRSVIELDGDLYDDLK